jgi:hypothetical protein
MGLTDAAPIVFSSVKAGQHDFTIDITKTSKRKAAMTDKPG